MIRNSGKMLDVLYLDLRQHDTDMLVKLRLNRHNIKVDSTLVMYQQYIPQWSSLSLHVYRLHLQRCIRSGFLCSNNYQLYLCGDICNGSIYLCWYDRPLFGQTNLCILNEVIQVRQPYQITSASIHFTQLFVPSHVAQAKTASDPCAVIILQILPWKNLSKL